MARISIAGQRIKAMCAGHFRATVMLDERCVRRLPVEAAMVWTGRISLSPTCRQVSGLLLPSTWPHGKCPHSAFGREIACAASIVLIRPRRLGSKVARFRRVNEEKQYGHHDALELPSGAASAGALSRSWARLADRRRGQWRIGMEFFLGLLVGCRPHRAGVFIEVPPSLVTSGSIASMGSPAPSGGVPARMCHGPRRHRRQAPRSAVSL
jgi:hypothetical protein